MAMKPDFALNLSFDGITLLQKVRGGWAELGKAGLDGDLSAEMTRMRDAAKAAGSADLSVKLVIPDDQIKFLDRDAPAGADPETAARDALDGQTPYAVDELRIDVAAKSGRLHVAAVARETLEEAEAFALEHGFVPVGFVAAGGHGFGREVCFGAAKSWTGKALKPEPQAIKIVPMPEPEPEPEPEPAPKPETLTDTTPDAGAPDPAEAKASATAPDTSGTEQDPKDKRPYPVRERAADPLAPKPRPADALPKDQPARSREKTAFVSMRARRDVPPPPRPASADLRAPATAQAARLSIRPVEADRIGSPDAPDPGALDSLTRVRPSPPPPAPSVAKAPTPPEVQSPRAAGVFGKGPEPRAPKPAARSKDQPIGKAAFAEAELPHDTPPAPPLTSAPAGTAIDSPALAEALPGGLEDAGLRPGMAADAAPTQPKRLGGLTAPKSRPEVAAKTEPGGEAERMTVFGARRKDNYVGGKPRFLGLILTAVLLLLLLGVAAWASVFLEEGLARFFRSPPPAAVATTLPEEVLPEPQAALPEPAAPMPEPVPPAAPREEARLAPEADPPVSDALPTPAPAPAPPRTLSPEEAEATYAATGIWQRAPDPPADIRESGTGDLYVASIDPDVPQFDANALPMAPIGRDPAYAAPPIPAPAGTIFDLDDRGLVRATPEGAVNPDRVRVFAGLPPAVPPLRGDALAPVVEAIPERPDGTQLAPTEIFQRLQEFNGFRPNSRPDDLQEQNDRANLTGLSRPELASLRPAMRPAALKEALEQDVTATAQAVAVSERPASRPANMARLVAAAQAQRQAAPAPAQVQQVAAVAPRTVAPSVPSNTSVSKAATERNAINLRKVNLIGIYGQPSSRRALVRLSNGRYVKVAVGDRLDGGRVSAIGEDQLRYVKSGRNLTLQMPRG